MRSRAELDDLPAGRQAPESIVGFWTSQNDKDIVRLTINTMTRQEAYELLTTYIKNKNLRSHCLAAEAAMKGLYTRLTPQTEQSTAMQEIWGITGLLHDIDYEVVQEKNILDKHGNYLFETGEVSLPDDITHAIQAHNYTKTGIDPVTPMDWAITACDQLTGLIVACALVRPEKTLEAVTPEAVLKKFNMSAFAKGADREMIKLCESQLKIPLPEFVTIVLTSMQEIHEDLGL